MIIREFKIFLTGILFFTRIPCPKWVDHSEEYLNEASRYLPLIGLIIGGLSGLVFFLSSQILNPSISIIISMISSVLLTGAFHEDGLADMCDGFGGGWTREKILEIMKDSRIGTFGFIGLLSVLSLKFISLNQLNPKIILIALFAGNSISRWFAISLLYTHSYARADQISKSSSFSKPITIYSLVYAGFWALIPFLFFQSWKYLIILPFLVLIRIYLGRMFKKWIGGFTGDCLGGVQQIIEAAFYLGMLILIKFI